MSSLYFNQSSLEHLWVDIRYGYPTNPYALLGLTVPYKTLLHGSKRQCALNKLPRHPLSSKYSALPNTPPPPRNHIRHLVEAATLLKSTLNEIVTCWQLLQQLERHLPAISDLFTAADADRPCAPVPVILLPLCSQAELAVATRSSHGHLLVAGYLGSCAAYGQISGNFSFFDAYFVFCQRIVSEKLPKSMVPSQLRETSCSQKTLPLTPLWCCTRMPSVG